MVKCRVASTWSDFLCIISLFLSLIKLVLLGGDSKCDSNREEKKKKKPVLHQELPEQGGFALGSFNSLFQFFLLIWLHGDPGNQLQENFLLVLKSKFITKRWHGSCPLVKPGSCTCGFFFPGVALRQIKWVAASCQHTKDYEKLTRQRSGLIKTIMVSLGNYPDTRRFQLHLFQQW